MICWNVSGQDVTNGPMNLAELIRYRVFVHKSRLKTQIRVKRSAALQEMPRVGNGSSTRCRNHQLCLSSSGLVSIAAACLTFK